MKIWFIEYNQEDTPSGWVFDWFPNKAEATARYKELNADLDGNKVCNLCEPKIMDVPTHNKQQMVSFLNTYASNGIAG